MKTKQETSVRRRAELVRPRVALVYGFWGQNIGNAFFNVAGQWILEQVFGAGSVGLIQDQPGYRTFYDQSRGNPRNSFDLIGSMDCDYVVLQGPMLTETFGALWEKTLSRLSPKTKVILLSAGFFKYTDSEIAEVRRFLERYTPAVVSTRDAVTYEILSGWQSDLKFPLVSGLDSAFAMPYAYRPLGSSAKPYTAFAFNRYPEPVFRIDGEPLDEEFEFGGRRWTYRIPPMPAWFAKKGKWQAYVGARLERRKFPAEIAGMDILRLDHRFNPHVTWKIYRAPNSIASDEPYTYATAYANTELTLSDRVHACVLTLAYGHPAMLFSPSPRGHLFARVGAEDVRKHPVTIDLAERDEILDTEIRFLREVLT